MATYLKGVKDYVPQLETFKPNYKFLSDVLSTRQDRYDTNYKSLNDLYSKVVYADMSREDNNVERDMYANQLSNGLKQVSGMDLSLAQNVDVAKGLFKPFFENKALVKDMTFTKMYQNENKKVNSMMTSSNDDFRERFWQDGVTDLRFQMDEYKNATADNALAMGMPKYVENPNLYKRAFEALKGSDLSIKQTTLEGDWIVTTKNGTALTRQLTGYERNQDGSIKLGENKQPIGIYKNPAAEYLRETVMRDPIVINGYRVQARNRARQFANNEENIQTYGSVDAASQAWANNMIQKQNAKDIKALAEQNTSISQEENAVANWETYKKNNGIVPGTAEDEVFLKKIASLNVAKQTRKLTTERIKKAKSPTSDLNELMNKAYSQYMASVMGPLMTKAAVAYSQVDAEQTFEANPFKKMELQYKYDLAKMSIKHGYDMKKMYAKAELESNMMGPAGIGGGIFDVRSKDANLNITGDLMDANVFEYNAQAQVEIERNVHRNEQQFITDLLKLAPGSFKDTDWLSESGAEMTYNVYNPDTKQTQQKTASLQTAFIDLAKPENEVEFQRIYQDAANKLAVSNVNGSYIYSEIPELNNNPKAAIQLQANLNKNTELKALLTSNVEEMQKSYAQALEYAESTGQFRIESDVPVPLLTERQVAMLKDGRSYEEAKKGSLDKAGSNLQKTREILGESYEGDKYQKLDNTKKRMLSKEEYVDLYVSVMKLLPEQRAQLEAPNASRSPGDYKFLVSEPGFFNTYTTAGDYWTSTSGGSASYASPTTGAPVSGTGSSGSGGVQWRFAENKARRDAAEIYDGTSEKDEIGNYKTGDGGILGSLNAVMTSPESGGKYGLPGYNLRAAMIGQDYDGTGQAALREYSVTYDHFNKRPEALNQLNSIDNAISAGAGTNSVLFGIGDDRATPISNWMINAKLDERTKAENIYARFISDMNTQYGKNNDRDKRPVITTSYVERIGGPDTDAEYAGYTLVPGSDYGLKFKSMFGDTDQGKKDFQTFLSEGISVAIPSKYDNNEYRSSNQTLSAADIIIQQSNEFLNKVPGGGEFSIYKNAGGQYEMQATNYGFNPSTGNIEPDMPYTQTLGIDKSQLDELVMTINQRLSQLSQSNINAQQTWKRSKQN
tara:strand:+ start:517 stop:3897 length:3381 start_codon:yes stop_codon:yes gene_type:complete